MLSREAIINLYPPVPTGSTGTGTGSGTDATPPGRPSMGGLTGPWHITHSADPKFAGRRNARINLEINGDDTFVITRTHQALPSSLLSWWTGNSTAIESSEQTLRNQAFENNTTRVYVHRMKSTTTNETIEIMAYGKEGQLEDWMIQDGSGWISDASGECRADWRNTYVVVYITGSETGPSIEIWDRFGRTRPLTSETIGKMRAALEAVDNAEFQEVVARLKPVLIDDGRDADDKERRDEEKRGH